MHKKGIVSDFGRWGNSIVENRRLKGTKEDEAFLKSPTDLLVDRKALRRTRDENKKLGVLKGKIVTEKRGGKKGDLVLVETKNHRFGFVVFRRAQK